MAVYDRSITGSLKSLSHIISRLRCISGCCLPPRSPNSVTKAGNHRSVSRRICAAKMASAPIVGEWLFSLPETIAMEVPASNFRCLANAMSLTS